MRVEFFGLAGLILMMGLPAASQDIGGIPRAPDGRPDLTGIYDANTLTQIERPAKYGGREALTDQEAVELLRTQATRDEEADKPSDPNRKAPKAGNAIAGKSYDDFWKSFGNRVVTIGGEKRSSIVIDPPDGKIPPMTEEGNARDDNYGGFGRPVRRARTPRPEAGRFRQPGGERELRALSARIRMDLGHADTAELFVQQPEADRSNAD